MKNKIFLSLVRISIGVVILLAITNMPSEYYSYLRTVVFLSSIIFAVNAFRKKKSLWAWAFIGVGILFNPFYQIILQKETWQILDIASGLLFLASCSLDLSAAEVTKIKYRFQKILKQINAKLIHFIKYCERNKLRTIGVFLVVFLAAVACLYAVLTFSMNINHIPDTTGASLEVKGNVLPGAYVSIYINQEFVEGLKSDGSGGFSKNIKIEHMGDNVISVKQSYGPFISLFGKSSTTNTDLTPPDVKDFTLLNDVPLETSTLDLEIKVKINPEVILVVNQNAYKPDSAGIVSVKLKLENGTNVLNFSLADKYDNRTDTILNKTIYADDSQIRISDSSGLFFNGSREVAVHIDQWTGYLGEINNVPIVGKIGAKIKSVTIDGKSVNWSADGTIYMRMNLYIMGGTNKYLVKATDDLGRQAEGYITTIAEKN